MFNPTTFVPVFQLIQDYLLNPKYKCTLTKTICSTLLHLYQYFNFYKTTCIFSTLPHLYHYFNIILFRAQNGLSEPVTPTRQFVSNLRTQPSIPLSDYMLNIKYFNSCKSICWTVITCIRLCSTLQIFPLIYVLNSKCVNPYQSMCLKFLCLALSWSQPCMDLIRLNFRFWNWSIYTAVT